MANKQVKIKKIRENSALPIKNNGNWYDLQTSAMICMQQHNIDWKWCDVNKVTDGFVKVRPGDTLVCYLGIACDMGEGYEAHLLPRSSTYLKYGLLLGNSMGLIDSEYKGDTDEWKALFYCTDYAIVPVNARLVQMEIVKSSRDIDFKEVDTLGNDNRGGYGSTGQ